MATPATLLLLSQVNHHGDALASSGWSAVKNAHIQLTDKAGTNAAQATLATSLAGSAHAAATTGSTLGETLNIIGGKNAVADSARTAFQASASAGKPHLNFDVCGRFKGTHLDSVGWPYNQ